MKKPKELEALERAFKTIIVMPQCNLFAAIVTPSYLQDYSMGEPDIVTQVELSKQLRQPTFLLLDQDLTPNELKQAEDIFKEHNVVAKISFDRNNMKKCERELFDALKPYGAKKKRVKS